MSNAARRDASAVECRVAFTTGLLGSTWTRELTHDPTGGFHEVGDHRVSFEPFARHGKLTGTVASFHKQPPQRHRPRKRDVAPLVADDHGSTQIEVELVPRPAHETRARLATVTIASIRFDWRVRFVRAVVVTVEPFPDRLESRLDELAGFVDERLPGPCRGRHPPGWSRRQPHSRRAEAA